MSQIGALLFTYYEIRLQSLVEVISVIIFISQQYEAAGPVCGLALPRDGGDGGEGEGEGPGAGRGPSEHQQAGQTALLQPRAGRWSGTHSVCGVARYCDAAKRDLWNLYTRSVHFMIYYSQNCHYYNVELS